MDSSKIDNLVQVNLKGRIDSNNAAQIEQDIEQSLSGKNNCPVETPVASEYKTNGIDGGIITPKPPATAIKPADHVLSYPKLTMKGTHIAPTAAVVAGPDPEIAP